MCPLLLRLSNTGYHRRHILKAPRHQVASWISSEREAGDRKGHTAQATAEVQHNQPRPVLQTLHPPLRS